MAEWVQYGKDPEGTDRYYDPDRISQMSNGNLIVWQKLRYSEAQIRSQNNMTKLYIKVLLEEKMKKAGIQESPFEMISYKDYSHTLIKHVFDCTKQMVAVASSYLYSNEGKHILTPLHAPVQKNTEPDWKFQDILPGGKAEKLMNIVLRQNNRNSSFQKSIQSVFNF